MTTSLLKSLFFGVLIFSFGIHLVAQDVRLGIPETVNYSKDEYRAGTQNWAVAQDESGLLIVGNNKGVLVFDGADWQLVPLPNRTIVRSLAKGPDGRIYVGGQDEFGFLDRDECQQICYRSISRELPENEQSFEDVWKIFVDGEQVYFCTQEALIRWDGKTFSSTLAQQRFENFFWLDDQLYAQEKGLGLLQWSGEAFDLIPQGGRFADARIAAMLPMDNEVLIVSDFDGLFRLGTEGLTEWETAVSPFLRLNQAYCALDLPNGQFAIGTAQEGLLIIDRSGQVLQHLNKESGLQNNTILSIFRDRLDNFWLATDNGIDYVKSSTPFSLVRDYLGIDGTGYTATIFEDRLYMGTNQGLFYLDWPVQRSGLSLPQARPVGQLSGQIWGFSNLGDDLMVNAHAGLFAITSSGVSPISTVEGSWKIVPLPRQPGLALGGGYTGLHLYKKNNANDQWEYLHKVSGFEESARVFEVDVDGDIWVSHAYKGLFRINLTDGNRTAEVKFYGYDEGLPGTISLNVLQIENELIATSPEGAYRFNREADTFESFEDLNNLLGGVGPIARLVYDADGRLWFSKGDEFGYFAVQQTGFLQEPTVERIFFDHLQEYLVDGFEHISAVDSNNLIIATEKGFISYHPLERTKRDMSMNVLIREVTLVNAQDSVLYSEGLMAGSEGILTEGYEVASQLNSMRFRYASPFYEQTGDIQFRYRLQGFQEEWSDWDYRKEKEFTNLPAGDYVFSVQARNTYRAVSTPKEIAFTVLPPWYASTFAKLVYALLGAVGIVGIFAYFSNRWRKQKSVLVAKQAETLAQKEAEFQEEQEKSAVEIDKLRSEKLEADVQHKTSQLASATMHLVQKGEVLLKIKKDLTKIIQGETIDDNRRRLQRIIHTIDGNTRLDGNWEQFEIYFDQVHKNFLQNLRNSYPELTPKDQKLCAYLRMNLTTKEIAPLMNISVRGVEISRYRLRKKLQLDTDTNLTDFIMRF